MGQSGGAGASIHPHAGVPRWAAGRRPGARGARPANVAWPRGKFSLACVHATMVNVEGAGTASTDVRLQNASG